MMLQIHSRKISLGLGLFSCLSFLLNHIDITLEASQFSVPAFVVTHYPAGNAPFQLQTGDFDGDGNKDFAVTNRDSHNVTIFLFTKEKQGIKVERWNYKTGRSPLALFAGDLDRDGDTDFVTANLGDQTITTLINKGKIKEYGILDLVQGKSYLLNYPPYALEGGDIDGDGDIDLAVVVEKFQNTKNLSQVMIFTNEGRGEFRFQTAYEAGREPRAITGADLDGDDAFDLVITNKGSQSVSLFFNDGKGHFPTVTNLEAGDSPHGIWAGDIDGDGDKDLVITNISTNAITLFKNQGQRRFGQGITFSVQEQFPFALVGADIDRDGDVDMITANLVGDSISLLVNPGDGSLRFVQSYPAGNGPRTIVAEDFNGDGLLDFVVGNRFSDDVTLFFLKP